MTTETFRRADHRPVPTSAHEAEASAVALRAPSEASASCCFPLDITHSPSRRRLSKEIVGRGTSLYATTGRPSIPPEQLLRALLLQVLYTVQSERLLMEELNYNLLFRWFVGLNMDDPVWHPTTFTKNRDRLLSGDVAAAFFDAVQAHARAAELLSDEHFTVDGTQLEAWASLKSFRCVDAAESDPPEDPGNPTVNFHGERRRNDTHQSTTDPEAMLHRKGKGKEAKLAYLGHVLLDNRQGLVANVCATHATGTAERDAAVLLLEASASPGSTVGADKGYDVARFVADVRVQDVTPHVWRRRSAGVRSTVGPRGMRAIT